MCRFTVEGDPYGDPFGAVYEIDARYTLAKRVLDEPMVKYLRVLTREIEPERSVLGFHARRELATRAKIDGSRSRVPIRRRCVPLLDVFRCRIREPHFFDGCRNNRRNDDLHGDS